MELLSKELCRTIREYVKERHSNVLLDALQVTRASKNGESFAADVLRISVGSTDEENNKGPSSGNSAGHNSVDPQQTRNPQRPPAPGQVKLIAKVAPKLKFRRDMYNIPVLFERERFMYTKLLPEFRTFQEARVSAEQPLFDNYPRLIKTSNETLDEFVLLNDLCEEGYRNFDRTQGLGLLVCKEIFRNFARLHAISFVYQAMDKEGFMSLLGDNLKETLFVKEIPESFELFLRSKVDLVKEKLSLVPREVGDDRVYERLEVFRKECANNMFASCNVRDYAVICHGDSWISNFMYKINGDKSLTVKLIDWQISRFTTPVLDLTYFIACSTDRKLRRHLPDLLLFYYNTLMEEIVKLGYDRTPPTELYPYKAFTRHCDQHMRFGFGMAILSLHSITCQSDDMPDVVSLLETASFEQMSEYSEILSKNPAYIERITDLVRDMVAFNYL